MLIFDNDVLTPEETKQQAVYSTFKNSGFTEVPLNLFLPDYRQQEIDIPKQDRWIAKVRGLSHSKSDINVKHDVKIFQKKQ